MRVRLTVTTMNAAPSAASTDVVIDARPGATFGEVRRQVLAAVGLPADSVVSVGGRETTDDIPLGLGPLVDGAVLCAGPPAGLLSPLGPSSPWRGAAELHVVSGAGAGNVTRLGRGSHVLGRAPECAVRLSDPGISRRHVRLEVTPDGAELVDLAPTNVTRVDGAPLLHPVPLRPGSRLRTGATTTVLRTLPVDPAPVAEEPGAVRLHSRPRFAPMRRATEITFPDPPTPTPRSPLPLAAALVPTLVAVVAAVLMRTPTMLVFALATPLILIGQWGFERRRGRVSERAAQARHRTDVATAEAQLRAALRDEVEHRRTMHPDLAVVAHAARTRNAQLWQRRHGHPEHLVVRVGCGDLPATTVVRGPAPAPFRAPHVEDVPLAVDLARTGVLGICGPRARAVAATSGILAQLGAWHSPDDVRVVLLTSTRDAATDWDWMTWLPHARRHGGRGLASVAGLDDPEALTGCLDEVAGWAAEPQSPTRAGDRGAPSVVVILDRAQPLRQDERVRALLETAVDAAHVAVVCVERQATTLPPEAQAYLVLDDGPVRARFHDREGVREVVPDLPEPAWAEAVARALAPLRGSERRTTPDVPSRVGFRSLHVEHSGTDPLDARSIADGWASGSTRPDALIGMVAGGPFGVDLTRDGPHALVGGTTGSGKSELLQTLVLALAIRHRPDELTFLLVDYKGGAALADCARLPHTLGVVTDLDPDLASRVLVSLQAEIRRREAALARAGAKDLDAYAASAAESGSLPRLVLVVDEFKVLAEELPDFVDGLVRVAAVGRSLGIHLVLATQRPGGIVTGDMRANISLRIALRVRDEADSRDVIEDAAAARIPPRLPGRALVRTSAGELLELQTAYAGGAAGDGSDASPDAPHVRPVRWEELGRPDPPAPACRSGGLTEMACVVDAVRTAADLAGCPAVPRPWLPPLPDDLPLDGLPRSTGLAGGLVLGLADHPADQSQVPYRWFPEEGHLGVAGGPRSGRSSALRAVADAVAAAGDPGTEVHVLQSGDALSDLADVPGVGVVAGLRDLDVARRLVARVAEVVDAPREEAHRVVLLVDGWEALEDAFGRTDQGETTDTLWRILRDGLAAGVHVVVTGGRAVAGGRLASLLGRRLLLDLPDPLDLAMAGVKDAPGGRRPPGRAVDARSGVLVQVGHVRPRTPEADGGRVGCRQPAAARARVRIVSLPTRLRVDELPDGPPGHLAIGCGGDEGLPGGFDGDRHRRLLVVGPGRSGRSTALATLAHQAHLAKRSVLVVTPRPSPLAAFAQTHGLRCVSTRDVVPLETALAENEAPVLLVDDAHLIEGTPVEHVLGDLARDDAHPAVVAASIESSRAAGLYRGVVPDLAKHGAGILLHPSSPADGDLFRLRVPTLHSRAPGRGLLVTDGEATHFQVALPCTEASTAGNRHGQDVSVPT